MAVTIERVLAATDFSRAGQRAMHAAAAYARKAGAQLRIVHVTPPKSWLGDAWGLESPAADAIQRHAADALKRAAESVDPDRALELSTGVLSGPAARSIRRAARDFEADLVVVGARGEHDAGGEPGLGGTSAKLLAAAEMPLLLVRRGRDDVAARVVAALDLGPRSHAVLEWASFAAGDGHLCTYHAYDAPFIARLEAYGLARESIEVYGEQVRAQRQAELGKLVAAARRTGATSQVVDRGDPALSLARYLVSVRPSLVVLGKHVMVQRPSPASSVGSVCRFVASSAAADVLVV
jgi:nucleotide-binding universal stress UspA family protein